MPATQADKAAAFQALHRNPGTFVIANAWDGGAARILQGLGFSAIATSSGAAAGVLGRLDGKITRDEALSHSRRASGSPVARSKMRRVRRISRCSTSISQWNG
jgi:2-methylisocitrate lyase-like PEP mutase family enzyme